MSVKHIGLSGLVVALCGLGMAHAQEPARGSGGADVLPLYTPSGSDAAAPSSSSSSASLPAVPASSSTAPAGTTAEGIAIDEGSPPIPPPVLPPLGPPASPYLQYPRSPCCCGPVGHCGGPIGSEIFVRSGLVFPIGGGIFGNFLRTGWDIEGGGRLFFFNQPSTKAWTATLSVSNMFARTNSDSPPIDLFNVKVQTAVNTATGPSPVTTSVPQVTATVSSLNMTFVNAGLGREWWLLGSADPGQQQGLNWRVGVDAGGRWGSAKVEFNELQHHTDVIGGIYTAIHSDVEYPWRCGILFGGIRLEYNYIWTSLLQDQNNGDFQSLNLLFQIGSRF